MIVATTRSDNDKRPVGSADFSDRIRIIKTPTGVVVELNLSLGRGKEWLSSRSTMGHSIVYHC